MHKHERWLAVLMFGYFFLIISTYWIIKPIKKALLVGHYQTTGLTILALHLNAAQVELTAKEINMLLAIVAALSFAKLASHFKRERLALYIIIFFSFGFTLFASLLNDANYLTLWLFYLYGDLFVTLMVAGFFAFLNDSGNVYTAYKVYGLIILGGVMGGFFGSAVVAGYAGRLEPSLASAICVGLLTIIAIIAWLAGRMVEGFHL